MREHPKLTLEEILKEYERINERFNSFLFKKGIKFDLLERVTQKLSVNRIHSREYEEIKKVVEKMTSTTMGDLCNLDYRKSPLNLNSNSKIFSRNFIKG